MQKRRLLANCADLHPDENKKCLLDQLNDDIKYVTRIIEMFRDSDRNDYTYSTFLEDLGGCLATEPNDNGVSERLAGISVEDDNGSDGTQMEVEQKDCVDISTPKTTFL